MNLVMGGFFLGSLIFFAISCDGDNKKNDTRKAQSPSKAESASKTESPSKAESASKTESPSKAQSPSNDSSLNLKDLNEISCFFSQQNIDNKQKSAFVWKLENSKTESTLYITISSDKIPESGSNWNFSPEVPLSERHIAYGQTGSDGFISAAAPAACSLKITSSNIAANPAAIQGSAQPGLVPQRFEIKALIDCVLANSKTGKTLKFNGEISCDNGFK